MVIRNILFVLIVSLSVFGSGFGQPATLVTVPVNVKKAVSVYLNTYINNPKSFAHQYFPKNKVKTDSVWINSDTLYINFSQQLAERPWRTESVDAAYANLKKVLPRKFKKYKPKICTGNIAIEQLIPNYFRTKGIALDSARLPRMFINRMRTGNVVTQTHKQAYVNGLINYNLALWNSHGYYYEPKLDRWEWQRARIFTTVEDLLTTSYTLIYLVPMLENAGANVFLPRERDIQTNMVIVDNDASHTQNPYSEPHHSFKSEAKSGYAIGNTPYENLNPFCNGTFSVCENATAVDSFMYIPTIPESGYYSVSVAYGKVPNAGNVTYKVYHSAGVTEYMVNQNMGYGTWIYLGTHHFLKGNNIGQGGVVILNNGKDKINISSDAVKFGGGMGIVSRNSKTSGMPRFKEAARYHLQFSGFTDTLCWNLNNNTDDIVDDYRGRSEWVNYLMGNPLGPANNPKHEGLMIPVHLSLAFHTDAGTRTDNSLVGTLAIYTAKPDNPQFADGLSRYASRDLTDIIQTQITADISEQFNVNWVRRGMWNSNYAEAVRPNVPAMLLELLSHQNFADMRYGLHPVYQFTVARAIYKGMLRFISNQYDFKYIVQPLPVNYVKSEISGSKQITLSWKPVTDSLEITAVPLGYNVYKRINNNGFDNGTYTTATQIVFNNIITDSVYSFKIAAVNSGGESFPSETVSACIARNSTATALIVNGFDRLDAPAFVDEPNYRGFTRNTDQGVYYMTDIMTIGDQYDFNKKNEWLDDDAPGCGGSHGNLEREVIPANTFDFAIRHGEALVGCGFSFATISDESFETDTGNYTNYQLLDIVFGEEKSTYLPFDSSKVHFKLYTAQFIGKLQSYLQSGGNVLISGSYIGSDIGSDSTEIKVIGNLLKFRHRTALASVTGNIINIQNNQPFTFITTINNNIYPAEAPDAIEPYDSYGKTMFRYTENNKSAGIFYKQKYGVVALGFPLECIDVKDDRINIMKQIINRLQIK